MKRAFTALGVIFALILVAILVGGVFLFVRGDALDRESKTYADAAIRAIVTSWDVTQLERRESPEFRKATTPEQLATLFSSFRRLGKLREYNGLIGQALMVATTQNGGSITASYITDADFENGSAKIQINLVKHGDQWQILGFRVNAGKLKPRESNI